MSVDRIFKACCVTSGVGSGEVLATSQPISFWGGIDPQNGNIIDRVNEHLGQSIAGKIFAFPFGKGSSGAPPVILELIRIGKAPAALVNLRTDPILALGPIISKHLYGREMPIVTLDEQAFNELKTGQHVCVDASNGELVLKNQDHEISSRGFE